MDKAKTFVEDNVNTVRAHVPSLADIGLLWEDIDDNFIVNESKNQENSNELSGCGLDSISDNVNDNDFQSKDTKNNGDQHKASDKISALEDELAKLRAQIALIVTSQEQKPSKIIKMNLPFSLVPLAFLSDGMSCSTGDKSLQLFSVLHN